MGINVPNRFTNLTQKADADKMNANFDAVAAKLNGAIGDDEVDEISESIVVMNPTSGHDHSGGSKGKLIVLAESQVTFDSSAGHNHDGTAGGGRLAALATTANQGTVKIRSGETDSINHDGVSIISLTGITTLLSLDLYWEQAGELTTKYLGGGYDAGLDPDDAEAFKAFYATQISNTGFIINNKLFSTEVFHWRVIGI